MSYTPYKITQIFDEHSTTELMVIEALQKNGWKYIPSGDLDRDFSDVIVESMLKSALIRLNPSIAEDPSRADTVLSDILRLISKTNAGNLITQNELFKQKIFEKNTYPFGENGRQVSIDFFGTEINGKSDLNEYVVTNQWEYPKRRFDGGKALDIVLLVNGIPVAVGEMKSPFRPSVSWFDGVKDILDYEQSIPQMFTTNVFNFATEGKEYYYGALGAPASKWGPWRTADNKADSNVDAPLASVRASVTDMITPHKVMDLFQFFTLFATDSKFRKYKIIARYQQYEGANGIVDRVRAGYPKQGLIWHFQGSGKSYLMEFAAVKLRMLPDLKNPTVIIVDDRVDLESQITAQFHASDVGNLELAGSRDRLMTVLRQDIRKIIITTIFRFQEVTEELSRRDNIIVLVDECHRTQEGDLGIKMRKALPNAFFFGLTGTPINRTDKNTFATFGAVEDRIGYMSKYSFSDSIRDKATLPLSFESVPIDLHVDQEIMNREFDSLIDENNLTPADRAELTKRVGMQAIMYDKKRIKKVCEHIAKHFTEKVRPNGYKALIVVYDRPCCVSYKEELDALLGAECSTIVMDTNDDKADKYKPYHRNRDEENKVLDDFRDPNNPLEIIIVTAKLLTGFDAPVLQTMYLDKPLKDHTLLQAICRTNRTFDANKTFGLIVDYIGIFDNVAKSLNFDEASMKKIVGNISELKNKIPDLMKSCLSYFLGVDRTLGGFEGIMAAQDCLPTSNEKDNFGADYKVLNRAWNALSPDLFLMPFQPDYVWLTKVYESVRPMDGRGSLIWDALGGKTMEIVHSNLRVGMVHDDMEIFSLTADMIDDFVKNKDVKTTTKRVEISLVTCIQEHSDDPKFKELGEKLEELRFRHEQALINSIEFLKALLDIARQAAQAEKEVVPEEEIDKGKAALTELFNGVRNETTPVIVERIVADIDEVVKTVRFVGWQNTTSGKQSIKKQLRQIIWLKYKIKDQEVFDKAYAYVEQYY